MEKGEVWLIDFPIRGGREQRGTRPGVVISDTNTGLVTAVPLTSNMTALRFPNTLEIKKSKINGLKENSTALGFQIQSIDKKRFASKIGELEDNYIEKLSKILKEMMEL